MIQRNHDLLAETLQARNMGFEVGQTVNQSVHVFLADFRKGNTAVPLQSSQRGYENGSGRLKVVHPALDVIELFCA